MHVATVMDQNNELREQETASPALEEAPKRTETRGKVTRSQTREWRIRSVHITFVLPSTPSSPPRSTSPHLPSFRAFKCSPSLHHPYLPSHPPPPFTLPRRLACGSLPPSLPSVLSSPRFVVSLKIQLQATSGRCRNGRVVEASSGSRLTWISAS